MADHRQHGSSSASDSAKQQPVVSQKQHWLPKAALCRKSKSFAQTTVYSSTGSAAWPGCVKAGRPAGPSSLPARAAEPQSRRPRLAKPCAAQQAGAPAGASARALRARCSRGRHGAYPYSAASDGHAERGRRGIASGGRAQRGQLRAHARLGGQLLALLRAQRLARAGALAQRRDLTQLLLQVARALGRVARALRRGLRAAAAAVAVTHTQLCHACRARDASPASAHTPARASDGRAPTSTAGQAFCQQQRARRRTSSGVRLGRRRVPVARMAVVLRRRRRVVAAAAGRGGGLCRRLRVGVRAVGLAALGAAPARVLGRGLRVGRRGAGYERPQRRPAQAPACAVRRVIRQAECAAAGRACARWLAASALRDDGSARGARHTRRCMGTTPSRPEHHIRTVRHGDCRQAEQQRLGRAAARMSRAGPDVDAGAAR